MSKHAQVYFLSLFMNAVNQTKDKLSILLALLTINACKRDHAALLSKVSSFIIICTKHSATKFGLEQNHKLSPVCTDS